MGKCVQNFADVVMLEDSRWLKRGLGGMLEVADWTILRSIGPCCDQNFVREKHGQRPSLSKVAAILARNTGGIPERNAFPTALTNSNFHPRSSSRFTGAPRTRMDTP